MESQKNDDNNMKLTFGGYLGLDELGGLHPLAEDRVILSSGRACLRFILEQVRPTKVLIPHFICNSVVRTIEEANVKTSFFPIDCDFHPVDLPELNQDEMLLVVDYFGLCSRQTLALSRIYGGNLIIDRSQAFFSQMGGDSWAFNSFRKFFGVPDGAQCFTPGPVSPPNIRNTNINTAHLLLEHAGHQTEGYPFFRINEDLIDSKVNLCSLVSTRLMERTNRDGTKLCRSRNFLKLHDRLKKYNVYDYNVDDVNGPYHYPLVLSKAIDLRRFHEAGIYAPILWPGVADRANTPQYERMLINRIVALPIDQRYNEDKMNDLATKALKIIEK